ncbi:hypothetical protein PG994_004221 [Apiospora phragmitis]|uniref:Uncharacterized protein n=1 Tax=Apiospora phragmitis TaxID=2905665 RepID=A0ABR1VQ42_9PEZI
MDVESLLDNPTNELQFVYPQGAAKDKRDGRDQTLRIERQGLRAWNSFEEDPPGLGEFRKHPIRGSSAPRRTSDHHIAHGPIISANLALEAIFPGNPTAIVGTMTCFRSYGTDDNRRDGEPEKQIAPDLMVVQTNDTYPSRTALRKHVLVCGDVKVQAHDWIHDRGDVIPGTTGCYESWLTQAVTHCIDLDLLIEWLQTSREVVFFHLCIARQTADVGYREVESIPASKPTLMHRFPITMYTRALPTSCLSPSRDHDFHTIDQLQQRRRPISWGQTSKWLHLPVLSSPARALPSRDSKPPSDVAVASCRNTRTKHEPNFPAKDEPQIQAGFNAIHDAALGVYSSDDHPFLHFNGGQASFEELERRCENDPEVFGFWGDKVRYRWNSETGDLFLRLMPSFVHDTC